MRRRVVLLALSAFAVPGCGSDSSDDESPGGLHLTFARAAVGGQCIDAKNGGKDFPEGVTSLKLMLSGPDYAGFCKTVSRDELGASGEVLVPHVPPGSGLTLDLAGCDGSGTLTWTGRTMGVDVAGNDKVAPSLYFTHRGSFSCTGTSDPDVPLCDKATNEPSCLKATLGPERAFHRMTAVAGSRMLVVGGFNAYTRPTEGEPAAIGVGDSAKGTILEYNPTIGLFSQWAAQLASPRAFHTLVPFDDGNKVLAIGGIARATLASSPSAPISPARDSAGDILADALPKAAVELIDVAGKSVKESGLGFDAKPLSATAASADGLSIVVTGGMLGSSEPSNLLQRADAASASELASGSVASFPPPGTMQIGRMGHTATWFGDGKVLLLGGVFEPETKPTSAKDIVVDKIAEIVEPGLVTTRKVEIAEAGVTFGPFAFHDAALLRDEGGLAVFLIAGGVHVYKDTNGPVFDPPSDTLLLLRIDTREATGVYGTFSDQSDLLNENLVRISRVFHSLTMLPGDLAMIAGGYNSLTTKTSTGAATTDNAACHLGSASKGCYVSDVLLLQVAGDTSSATLSVVPGTPTLSRGRFGLATAALPDGTVLSTGGVLTFTSDKAEFAGNVIGDAELYNPAQSSDADACAPCP